MISDVLIPQLQQRFPNRGLRISTPPGPCAVFPAIHADVGDIEIHDDGDELTVVAGNFTHGHFSNYDSDLSPDEKAKIIADEVVAFLENLFADRIVLWGSHHGSGGWYSRGGETDNITGLFKERGKEYVWSGPLPSA